MKPDKLTKKILRFMASKGANRFCSLSPEWNNETDIRFEDLCEAVHASENEVSAAISFLKRHDLAKYRSISSRSGPVPIAFCLTHEGLHFREFEMLSSKEKWLQRLYGFLAALVLWGAEELIRHIAGL